MLYCRRLLAPLVQPSESSICSCQFVTSQIRKLLMQTIKPLQRLLFAQGGLCFFCQNPLPKTEASVEHLVASANGGADRDDNCVACCKSLNNMLGSMSLKQKIQVVLNQKGRFQCPNGVQKTAAKKTSQALSKATKPAPEQYDRVVEDLKKRSQAKPGSVAKLKNTIATLFQKNISQKEVDALVQELQRDGLIS